MVSFVIEKESIKNNAREIISRAGDAKVIAVVKGRGYGFGIPEYARILYDEGIRFFAVTEVHDAMTLKNLALDGVEVLMLRSTSLSDELTILIENDVILTIGSFEAAVNANKISHDCGRTARVHVKIDTGMGRYGFLPSETEQIVSVYTKFENLHAEGLYTHLSSAFGSHKITECQLASLFSVQKELSDMGLDVGMLHFANSAYLFRFGEPLGDAVRIGSAFTGRIACGVRKSGLIRTGHLEGEICEIRWLRPGSKVGYGGTFKARRAVRTAVIPIGYSDGFGVEKAHDSYRLRDGVFYSLSEIKRTLLHKRLYVNINGKSARVLGHIGMTHTVCDVTKIECEIGDIVSFDVNPIYVSPDILREYI